jgi:hypothetical protein
MKTIKFTIEQKIRILKSPKRFVIITRSGENFSLTFTNNIEMHIEKMHPSLEPVVINVCKLKEGGFL